ncbi:MAG: hypothetical protein ACLGHL_07335 [Actinomycetota bacterium]
MSPIRSERGTGLVETLLLGLLLMVPLIWTLSVLAELHRAALASTSAARSVGASVSRAPGGVTPDVPQRALMEAFRAHGLDASGADLSIHAPRGFQRGARVSIEVSYRVPVLKIPLLGSLDVASIGVEAVHTAAIQRYASATR